MAAGARTVTLAGVLRSTIRLSDPHLLDVVEWIPFLPLSFRKVLLTVCKSGLPAGVIATESRFTGVLEDLEIIERRQKQM